MTTVLFNNHVNASPIKTDLANEWRRSSSFPSFLKVGSNHFALKLSKLSFKSQWQKVFFFFISRKRFLLLLFSVPNASVYSNVQGSFYSTRLILPRVGYLFCFAVLL